MVGQGDCKSGAAGAAAVLKVQGVAGTVADKGVKVAVAVDVGELGHGGTADIAQAKGIADGRGKGCAANAQCTAEKRRIPKIAGRRGT